MKQGKLVTISGLRTHMDFEVEAWDLQNYASGHIFWPDGPDDWQHHIGFAKSGKSQSAFAFGRQDFAQFHLRCEPNNPQRFTVLYQNTKVAIKDLELTNGVHDYSFTIEGTIAEE